MEIPSPCLESLSYSSSGNTDIIKYTKTEKSLNHAQSAVMGVKNKSGQTEETSCQKSGHYPRYGIDRVTHTGSCATSLELQVINFPILYVPLDFFDSEDRYYYFHFKYDTLKLSSRENKTAKQIKIP